MEKLLLEMEFYGVIIHSERHCLEFSTDKNCTGLGHAVFCLISSDLFLANALNASNASGQKTFYRE